MGRITTADLACAAEWCESYESLRNQGTVDEVAEAVHRVAKWLRAEIVTRNTRKIAREHGIPVPTMRRILDEAEKP